MNTKTLLQPQSRTNENKMKIKIQMGLWHLVRGAVKQVLATETTVQNKGGGGMRDMFFEFEEVKQGLASETTASKKK